MRSTLFTQFAPSTQPFAFSFMLINIIFSAKRIEHPGSIAQQVSVKMRTPFNGTTWECLCTAAVVLHGALPFTVQWRPLRGPVDICLRTFQPWSDFLHLSLISLWVWLMASLAISPAVHVGARPWQCS